MRQFNYTRLVDVAQVSASTYALFQKVFPQVLWSGAGDGAQLALTFDDGPHPEDTLQLLEVLARHGAPATFFYVGQWAERWPDLVREVAAAGHEIGLHGWRHRPLVLEAPLALRGQLRHTRQLLAELTGREAAEIRYLRPPYGVYTPATLARLVGWGYRPVMGSIVPVHWMQPRERTLRQVLANVRPGMLLVLHESNGGPAIAELTDALLALLKEGGYTFVGVDEMWQTRAGPTGAG